MLFNFINVPAIFQTYINKALADLIDINYIAYFDDIFIYFFTYNEHRRYIQQMLERLRQYELYVKLFKCEFSIILIIFLGFVINTDEIKMDINKIEVITE
jgi:hypothetical protein